MHTQAGQENPGTFLGQGEFVIISYSRLWVCCIMCRPVEQGFRNDSGEHCGGAFDELWHPLSCLPCECPVDVTCVVEGSTAGPVCVREDGCSLPLTRDCTQNLYLHISRESKPGLCMLGVVSPTPNSAREEYLLCLALLWTHSSPSALFSDWRMGFPFIQSQQFDLQSKFLHGGFCGCSFFVHFLL